MGLSSRNCEVSPIGKMLAKQVILLSAALNGDEVKIVVKEVLSGSGDIKVVVVSVVPP